MQAQLDKTQQKVDRYAVELQRHSVESVEREVRWLSDLINAERDGAHGERGDQSPSDDPETSPTGQQDQQVGST